MGLKEGIAVDQEKIGKFIADRRRAQGLTQEQLAERLGISKNAVSKWERGLNLPDVSLMQPLCGILQIDLNELFAGETLGEAEYKAAAEDNLLAALEHSAFTRQEKIAYFKRKWRREHIARMVLCAVIWLALVLVLKLQQAAGYLIGGAAGLLAVLFYGLLHNQMMAYVEGNVYQVKQKLKK